MTSYGPTECVECKKLGCPTEGFTKMCPKCAGIVCFGHFNYHYENCSGQLEHSSIRKWPIEIGKEILDPIVKGVKTVESRSPDPENPAKHYWKIEPGDIIQFILVDENYKRVPDAQPVEFRVVYVKKYSSIRRMLEAEGLEKVLPGLKSIKEGIKLCHSFPGYKERIRKYGIFAFKIEPVEN